MEASRSHDDDDFCGKRAIKSTLSKAVKRSACVRSEMDVLQEVQAQEHANTGDVLQILICR